MERDITTHIQSQERLQAFTLKEIKEVIKMLNQRKARLDIITAKMLKELPKGGAFEPRVNIQCHTTARIQA